LNAYYYFVFCLTFCLSHTPLSPIDAPDSLYSFGQKHRKFFGFELFGGGMHTILSSEVALGQTAPGPVLQAEAEYPQGALSSGMLMHLFSSSNDEYS